MNIQKKTLKYDILLLIILLFSAIIIYIFYNSNTNIKVAAQILINGKTAHTVSLNENKTFSFPELPSIEFEITDGKIRFLKSNCPDKICVNTGYINKVGQTAVCLPNSVSLRIISADNNASETLDTII